MSRSTGLALSIKALGGKLGGQWERERRETFFLLGAVLLTALPHLIYMPLWISLVFGMLFMWRTGLVISGRYLPRPSVRIVAALGCTLGVYAYFHTLFGREPGVALLILFLGLKLMEMRARRDLLVVIFLCFFLLLASFFNSQSLWTAAVTLVAVAALLASMITMQFGDAEQPINRRFRFAGTLMLQSLPVAALIFVAFPRLSQPLWGLPSDAKSAKTGLSEQMSPGQISSLSESREVAFRVKFKGATPNEKQSYWRGPTFGSYDGQTWRPLQKPIVQPPVPQLRAVRNSPEFSYTVTLEPHQQRWIYGLEVATEFGLVANENVKFRSDYLPVLEEPVSERVRYNVTSSTQFQIGNNETKLTLQNWLELPPGFNPKTLQMAAKWQNEEAGDPQKLIDRTLSLFRNQPFRYTMRPPVLGRNGIDDFFFNTQAGFCEHYAQAFVVLMRALDIPSRVVTGYHGGELNPVDEFFIVRQSDAHAWAEVWLESKGWVRVDPTQAIAPERIEKNTRQALSLDSNEKMAASMSPLARIKYSLDALTNGWNQWVLSYDNTKQKSLFKKLGLNFDDWHEIAMVIAAILLLVIGACALLTLHPKTPKDPLERVYGEFSDRLAAAGLSKQAHETGQRFFQRIERLLDPSDAKIAKQFTRAYYAWRYGIQKPSAEDVRHLRALIASFKP
jgi:protein-glutamine gamma-glutamyltransferase